MSPRETALSAEDPFQRLRAHAETRKKMTKAQLLADAEMGDEAYINMACEKDMAEAYYKDLEAQLAALVRTPETLDVDSDDFRDQHERAIRAHILEGPEDHRCDDLCSAAIIDRLVGKHPSNEYPLQPLYVAASPAPDPGAAQCGGYAGDPGASAPRCESYRGHPGRHFIRPFAPSAEPPETT